MHISLKDVMTIIPATLMDAHLPVQSRLALHAWSHLVSAYSLIVPLFLSVIRQKLAKLLPATPLPLLL